MEKDLKELEIKIKEFIEKYDIREFSINIMDLYNGKKNIEVKVR